MLECKRKAIREFEVAEDAFYKKEYYSARNYYLQLLTYDCMDGRKIKYLSKKKILFTDLVNSRITQIDTIAQRNIREKKRNCVKILQYADTMFAREEYEESGGYYRYYLKENCCLVKQKAEINSKIANADSLKVVKDSIDKVKLCSIILQHADNFYKHKEFEQALKYIGFYQKNHACPIQDTNKIFFKIIALDSLVKLEKN